MKHKIRTASLAFALAFCLSIGFAACDKGAGNTNGGSEAEHQTEPLGEHKHVYTTKSACDLCGEEWHATETDAYTFTPIVRDGVDGYDVMFGEWKQSTIDPETGRFSVTTICGKPYEGEELVLPCVHEGKPVISVGYYHSCSSATVKKITIPDSVFSFGTPQVEGAFPFCVSLEELVLPYEPNLGSVTGSTDALPLSFSALFGNYEGMSTPISQNFQDGALYIGDYLIYARSVAGRTFTVKEGTKGIAAGACDMYDSVIEEIRIPDSVTEIGDGAFMFHSNVENVSPLKKVVFGENSNLKKIDSMAFYGCWSLTEIDLPDGLEEIGGEAFERCISLSEIRIPDSVRRVGLNAFFNTAYESENIRSSLYEYNIQGDEVYNGNCLIKVNPDFEGHYTVREGTTAIAGGAFRGCLGVTSVTLPEDLTAIEAGLFVACAIESIELPKSVKSIGASAFENCQFLTSITIPEGVTEIGATAFQKCTALESVTIPKSVRRIGANAFGSCKLSETLVIPDGVENIGSNAFGMCEGVKKIVLPNSVRQIAHMAFYVGGPLTEIEFHGTVAEWMKILTSEYGNYSIPETIEEAGTENLISSTADYTIVCTDGTIASDGTVTRK